MPAGDACWNVRREGSLMQPLVVPGKAEVQLAKGAAAQHA